jgi:hypothetical protein
MATTEEIEGNRLVFNFEDPAGYSAFKIGNDTGDRRHWNRHEESRQLQDLCITNPTQARIVVKYGESYTAIKGR